MPKSRYVAKLAEGQFSKVLTAHMSKRTHSSMKRPRLDSLFCSKPTPPKTPGPKTSSSPGSRACSRVFRSPAISFGPCVDSLLTKSPKAAKKLYLTSYAFVCGGAYADVMAIDPPATFSLTAAILLVCCQYVITLPFVSGAIKKPTPANSRSPSGSGSPPESIARYPSSVVNTQDPVV